MQYRPFGKTGVNISTLGFGCMRLPEIQQEDGSWIVDQEKTDAMLRHAYDLGVNYFDTALFYCHENSEIAVGKALKPIRDKVYISTKCPLERVSKPEDFRKTLEESLRKLDTPYVDFYHFWGINQKSFDEKIIPMNLIGEAQKLKEEGLIRHISFSFHDSPEALKHIIDNGPELESVLLQYNLLDRANEEMIQYAASKGVGVVVMGPVGGGRLAAPTELAKKLGGENLNTYELALRFVLGNPGVCCALSGMQTYEMVDKNAAVASLEVPMTEADWRAAGESMENLKKFSELYCTGCGYCQPCPKGIVIPKIFEAYTYHNVYGLTETAKNTYQRYLNNEKNPGVTSEACIGCGYCERKCPQHLNVRELLRKVEGVLAGL
ncbi:MAG: 4Fe-4S dicluster domain-containing protein [Clostridiales bacterium]|nr:4Fe-4S dicluster domain-containing protein [Clostridiales bacterium]